MFQRTSTFPVEASMITFPASDIYRSKSNYNQNSMYSQRLGDFPLGILASRRNGDSLNRKHRIWIRCSIVECALGHIHNILTLT